MTPPKRSYKGLAVLLSAVLLICFFTGALIYLRCGESVYARFMLRGESEPAGKPDEGAFSAERIDWRERHYTGQWTQVTRLGDTLVGDHYRPDGDSSRWVLVAAGEQGRSLYREDLAKSLQERGYHTLIVELRAHGRSGGEVMGWGLLDSEDMLGWIAAITQADPKAEIVLYGFSTGAAAMLLTAPVAPAAVVGVMADSAFSDLESLIEYRLKRMGLSPFPYLSAGSYITRREAGFAFSDCSPAAAAALFRRPLLLLHGEDDTDIPIEMARAIFSSAAGQASESNRPGDKTLLTFPGAEHCQSITADPDRYWKAVDSFFAQVFR